ncbi:MAG: helix-turn-helix transcriptional regulator [Gammaproteobacteria bacterium]|nr:helix-turn-helix transcriptional regulator [Gammaproteobacteria bacterium]
MEDILEGGIRYEELHLLLGVIDTIHKMPLRGGLPSTSIAEIIHSILPCRLGGIGVFDRNTNRSQICIPMGDIFERPIDAEREIPKRSAFYDELIANWLNTRQLLYVDHLNRADNRLYFDTKVKSDAGNIVFDAVIRSEHDIGCFYLFTNINASLLHKYKMIMRLLLSCVYDVLTPIAGKSESGEGELIGLTGREQEIIARIRAGLNNKNIARQLNISVHTVKSHIYNIFQKLQASNRVEALLKAEQAGYLNEVRHI